MGIDCGLPSGHWKTPLRHIDVSDLTQGMHARVGPAGAMNYGSGTAKNGERMLQEVLNRLTSGLALPSPACMTVVRDREP